MKVPHGVCMKSHGIIFVMKGAKELLKRVGVAAENDAVWLNVRDWLRSRRAPRSARQTALAYLDLIGDTLLQPVKPAG